MDYISIKYLQTFLGYTSPAMLFEEQLIKDLEVKFKTNPVFQQENKQFDLAQVKTFSSTLKNQEQIVFDQWVLESKGLKTLLIDDKLTFFDWNQKLPEHFMFKDFSAFVSPFILPALIQNLSKKERFAASYLPLLNAEASLILQSKITELLDEKWQNFSGNQEVKTNETIFNQAVKSMFSDEQMQVVNFLKKEFYAQKVRFIERAILLFQHPQASFASVLWLCKQLNKLKLNPEHEDKVKEISFSINQNDGLYFKAREKNSWDLKKIVLYFIFPSVIVALIYLIFIYPSDRVKPLNEKGSSFSHFSKKERQQMDSLIRIMEKSNGENEIDPNQQTSYLHLTPVDIELIRIDTLENIQAETYVKTCRKAYELVQSGKINDCFPYTEKHFKNLSNKPFLDINQLKGELTVFIQNTSKYQVQILLFDSIQKGKVYSKFLQTAESVSLKAKVGQKIIFIPGNNLSKANFDKNLGLSEIYQHHFCFMDGNFISQLLTHYTIQAISEKEIKIQLNDDEENGFYLVDIYQGLVN